MSETIIKEAVLRYARERDRYARLAARVADICRVEIVEAHAVRAQVSFRAKSMKSFEDKLRRRAGSLRIGDLAGVRVATFGVGDEARVVREIAARFQGVPSGGAAAGDVPVAVESKDRFTGGGDSFYRAVHCQAALREEDFREEDLAGGCESLRGLGCEIQVCSLMAQVWNEIEHDIGYKQTGDGPHLAERSLLRALGHLTRSAEEVVSRLLEANAVRLREQTGDFRDVFDFLARLEPDFPGVSLARHAGRLFEALQGLGLTSPEKLRREIGDGRFSLAAARRELDRINGELKACGAEDCLLEDQSSDLILALLLDRLAGRLAARGEETLGQSPASRLARIAARWREGSACGACGSPSGEKASKL